MKSLLVVLAMFATTTAFAGVELGKYTATGKDEPTLKSAFELKADKTLTLEINITALYKCTGTWDNTVAKTFKASVKCPTVPAVLQNINVEIDVTGVTAAGLRTKDGVQVPLTIKELGEEPMEFMLKKAD